MSKYAPITAFVAARHNVHLNRKAGKPRPWTKDPILQAYRFCNVYRELDTVTQWIDKHWREELKGDHDMWFAMVVARLVNHPHSLKLMKIPGNRNGYNPDNFSDTLERGASRGDKVFGSAYIVSTNGMAMPKPAYLRDYVLAPLWEQRHYYRPETPAHGESLKSFHTRLIEAQGLGSFMAAQVVADVKNSKYQPLCNAEDWYTWAAPGPGSMRGLARVLYGTHEKKVPVAGFLPELNALQEYVNERFTRLGWPALCAQDVQNCLCEFDKYERVRLGQGTPRQRYPGQGEDTASLL